MPWDSRMKVRRKPRAEAEQQLVWAEEKENENREESGCEVNTVPEISRL